MIDEWVSAVLDFVASIDPLQRTLFAGLAMMLETSVLVGFLVPGDTVVVVAALAIDSWQWWLGLIIATVIGALCGESFGYAIGRWLGPRIERMLQRRLPKAAVRWRRTEHYLAQRGGAAVFLSRFLPVAHSLVPMIAGATGMSYRRFMAWTIPACIIWASVYSSIGWLAGDTFRANADRMSGAGLMMFGILGALFGLVYLAKRWLSRRESRMMEAHTASEATDTHVNGAT